MAIDAAASTSRVCCSPGIGLVVGGGAQERQDKGTDAEIANMMQDWHNLIGRQPVNQEMKLLPPTVKIAIHLDRLLSSGIFHSTAGGRGQRRGAEPHVVSREDLGRHGPERVWPTIRK